MCQLYKKEMEKLNHSQADFYNAWCSKPMRGSRKCPYSTPPTEEMEIPVRKGGGETNHTFCRPVVHKDKAILMLLYTVHVQVRVTCRFSCWASNFHAH